MEQPRLTPDEDAELRLLHSLRGFGAVARSIGARYEALRARDRRKKIREPDDTAVVQPVAKSPWHAPAPAPVMPAENPAVEYDEPSPVVEAPQPPLMPGPQRTDTLEVLADTGERRRFFR